VQYNAQKGIQNVVGRHEGKRRLAGHKRRWENNIKMNIRETG